MADLELQDNFEKCTTIDDTPFSTELLPSTRDLAESAPSASRYLP